MDTFSIIGFTFGVLGMTFGMIGFSMGFAAKSKMDKLEQELKNQNILKRDFSSD